MCRLPLTRERAPVSRLTTPGKLSVGGGTKFCVYVTPWPLSLARLEVGKSATKLARSIAWKPSTLRTGGILGSVPTALPSIA